MPYEIFPDGRVRADTPDEIINLWAKLKKPATETTVSQPNTEILKKPETEVSRPSCIDSWNIFTKALSAPWHMLRIPVSLGHWFRRDLDSCSGGTWTRVPATWTPVPATWTVSGLADVGRGQWLRFPDGRAGFP